LEVSGDAGSSAGAAADLDLHAEVSGAVRIMHPSGASPSPSACQRPIAELYHGSTVGARNRATE
jgi:hypothetical protein